MRGYGAGKILGEERANQILSLIKGWPHNEFEWLIESQRDYVDSTQHRDTAVPPRNTIILRYQECYDRWLTGTQQNNSNLVQDYPN